MDIKQRHEELILVKRYNPDDYPIYDNMPGCINVDKTSDIPCDYSGLLARVFKDHDQKRDRTRTRAEVFTPSWVCNEQNNLVDEQWFGGTQPFNEISGTEWKAKEGPILFAEKGSKLMQAAGIETELNGTVQRK